MRIRSTPALAVVSVTCLLVSLSACSSPRSVEEFCNTLAEHKEAYLESMSAASAAGGLEGLLQTASAIGDLRIMWEELADVAPTEIQSDAEAVRDAWKAQEEAAVSGDYAGAVVTGLVNAGSMSRVDEYIRTNCDGDYSVGN